MEKKNNRFFQNSRLEYPLKSTDDRSSMPLGPTARVEISQTDVIKRTNQLTLFVSTSPYSTLDITINDLFKNIFLLDFSSI